MMAICGLSGHSAAAAVNEERELTGFPGKYLSATNLTIFVAAVAVVPPPPLPS